MILQRAGEIYRGYREERALARIETLTALVFQPNSVPQLGYIPLGDNQIVQDYEVLKALEDLSKTNTSFRGFNPRKAVGPLEERSAILSLALQRESSSNIANHLNLKLSTIKSRIDTEIFNMQLMNKYIILQILKGLSANDLLSLLPQLSETAQENLREIYSRFMDRIYNDDTYCTFLPTT